MNITLSLSRAIELTLKNVDEMHYIFEIDNVVDADSFIVLLLVALIAWFVVFPHLRVISVTQ